MSERSRRSMLSILRAIIYARLSKDDGKNGRSCKEQIDSCTADCEYEGWPIGETLEDNDRGASRHSKRERENFLRLPEILRPGDVLVVWEPSRITRDMAEFGIFCDMCAERGVLLYYDDHLWDLNDDDDRNRVWQDILDGAKQVAKTRKRVIRAINDNLKNNRRHGRKPPGYDVVYQGGESVGWVVNPGQQRILMQAADQAIAGSSARSISKDHSAQWIAAGGNGVFAPRDVTRILTNPTIFGWRVHDEKIVGTGDWNPLLDPALYKDICAALKRENQNTHRGAEPKYLLTNIARCGICVENGEPGTMERKKQRSTRHGAAYFCKEYEHVVRDQKRVDDHVEELLMRLLENPETKAKLSARNEVDRELIDADLAMISTLQGEIRDYVKDAARKRLPPYAVTPYVEELQAQIDSANARVDAMTVPIPPGLLDAMGPDARPRWRRRTMQEKRNLIRATLTVTIDKVERRGRYSELGVRVRPLRPMARLLLGNSDSQHRVSK